MAVAPMGVAEAMAILACFMASVVAASSQEGTGR